MSEALVEVRDLSVDYLADNGAFPAVKNVSFDIGRARSSGSPANPAAARARSPLRSCGWPSRRPGSQAAILLDGEDMLKLPEAALRVRWRAHRMVFQSAMNSLNPVMPVEAQFRDVLPGTPAPRGRSRAPAPRSSSGWSASRRAGSTTIRISSPAACASASSSPSAWRSKPELIIMDEPTTALDVVVQREILQEVIDLSAASASPSCSSPTTCADGAVRHRIGVMLKGELVEVGDVGQVSRAPRHDYTSRLWQAIPRCPGGSSRGVVA